MKLWSPQTERRLGGISAVPCNNLPLSHWQSLIIQYEEDSSLSPPLSLSCFLFFMSSFLLPLSVLCNLRTLPLSPFHSPPIRLSHSPRFGCRVDSYTYAVKAKLIPLFQRDTRAWHALFVHKLFKTVIVERSRVCESAILRGTVDTQS